MARSNRKHASVSHLSDESRPAHIDEPSADESVTDKVSLPFADRRYVLTLSSEDQAQQQGAHIKGQRWQPNGAM